MDRTGGDTDASDILRWAPGLAAELERSLGEEAVAVVQEAIVLLFRRTFDAALGKGNFLGECQSRMDIAPSGRDVCGRGDLDRRKYSVYTGRYQFISLTFIGGPCAGPIEIVAINMVH